MLLPKSIELLSLTDIHCNEDIEETGTTFKENALIKSKYIFEKYKLNCFADDSGLEVETLNGEPGVYSARYAGLHKSDEDNNQKLLSELKNKTNRKACFKSVIVLTLNGNDNFFEGVIKGEVIESGRGDKGFGYDPLFRPFGFDKTFAQMTTGEKLKISHRAIAVNKLVDFLRQRAI